MVVGAKVCDLTEDLLWFVCSLYVGILTSSLMHINIQSLYYKLDHLKVIGTESNTDILCVTESWLTPDIADNEIMINEYSLIR